MRLLLEKRIIVLALISILALAVLACGGDSAEKQEASGIGATESQPTATLEPTATPEEKEPFRIGVMESLTGPGETYGTVANRAKQMALDEINGAGGIDGRMLELIVEDSKCGAADAITAYHKLTEVDNLKIILGDLVQRGYARSGAVG